MSKKNTILEDSVTFLKYLSSALYVFALVFLLFRYWKTNIGEDEKFKTLIALFGSLSFFFTIYSFYLQNQKELEESKAQGIRFYSDSFKDIFDDTIRFFMKYPKMNYYYRDLIYNDGNYKEEERDKTLENQITIIIISRAGPIIRYIEDYKTTNRDDFYYKEILIIEDKFKSLISSFFGSKIFTENYTKVKKGLASDLTQRYIQENFNK